MNISLQHNPLEFENFLFKSINLELYKFKYLYNYIRAVKENYNVLYNSSLINFSENGWILILHGDILLIYGENWSAKQLEEIKASFVLNEFKNYTIAGDAELLNQLLQLYQIPRIIQKERIFYRSRLVQDFTFDGLIIELGNQNDLVELAQMLQQYYHEEYKGMNDKSINEMISRVEILLERKSIFVLKRHDNSILSLCTINNPDIGILFTHMNERKKGYGKSLLSYCSKLLLNSNQEVYLMTDKNELPSNLTCKKVGYEPIFFYQQILIN